MTFDEKLEEVLQELLRARAAYEAWWNLKSHTIRRRYVGTMNLYSEYFSVAIHSHFVAMLLTLFRLYDEQNKALSLPRLVASLQSEPGVSSAVAKKAEKAIGRAQPTLHKLKHLRDKVFAHRERSYTYERAFREASLSAKEVRILTERTLRIVNDLFAARNLATCRFERLTEQHMRALLRDLHGHRRKRRGP